MTEPLASHRQVQPLDLAMERLGDRGWDDPLLQAAFAPSEQRQTYEPADKVKMALALLRADAATADVVEWLLDLTLRVPFPAISGSFEQAALSAAKHQARDGIGRVIVQAIADGERLLQQKRT